MLTQDRIESFCRKMSVDLAKLRRRSEIYDEMTVLMAPYDASVRTGNLVFSTVFIELDTESWQRFESLAKELHSEDHRQDRAVSEHSGYSWFGAVVIPKRAALSGPVG